MLSNIWDSKKLVSNKWDSKKLVSNKWDSKKLVSNKWDNKKLVSNKWDNKPPPSQGRERLNNTMVGVAMLSNIWYNRVAEIAQAPALHHGAGGLAIVIFFKRGPG